MCAVHEFIALKKQRQVSLFPGLFYLSHPLFTTFATWIVLYIRISHLSVRTQVHLCFGMVSALFSSGWFHVLGQVEYPLLVLVVPQTLAFLSNNVSVNITLL